MALLQERVSLDLDKSSDSKLVLSCVEDLGYKISDTDAISSEYTIWHAFDASCKAYSNFLSVLLTYALFHGAHVLFLHC